MNYKIIDSYLLDELSSNIKELNRQVKELNSTKNKTIYNNDSIKQLLGIQDKLLRKYRDEGMLAYHRVGDKYWYTQDDVDTFLARFYKPAFNCA
ncbi:MAG: DNA-binding protein [Alphaproteobacteria bacterium]|nr:DNA-binding protein [Alphaproteobacteria bacterium]